ncbi:MAG: enoyl-CoA hydratase/isomerase family protein [Burkholderiaceae bacterium]|nr:enoyl-CoA hydratase/isomerase family protein [Burkholderiaceae bacterium]
MDIEPIVRAERRGDVLVVTLQRAPVNAINDELLAQLADVLDGVEADDTIAVLHLRSACKVFCAGADLALIRSCVATAAGREAMLGTVRRMQRVFARLEALPCVTLAELGGAALGGGFELALACDLRIAACEARVGLPEAGLGLLAAAGGTQRLTRLVGHGLARRLILGAETPNGSEAARLGLVQWAVPRERLAAEACALAERYGAMPRLAFAENKRCIALAGVPGDVGFAAEIDATRRLYQHPETVRRVSAFLDKSAERGAVQPNRPTQPTQPTQPNQPNQPKEPTA